VECSFFRVNEAEVSALIDFVSMEESTGPVLLDHVAFVSRHRVGQRGLRVHRHRHRLRL
jgi:hypothetical protein